MNATATRIPPTPVRRPGYLVLRPVNGPRAGEERAVRCTDDTMANLMLPDRTWVLYDRNPERGTVDVVHWRELPSDSEPRPVEEIHRHPHRGVL